MQVYVQMCAPAYRGQRSTSGVFHHGFPPFSPLREVFYVCIYVCGLHMMVSIWIARTIFRNQFFPSNSWVPGTKIKPSDLSYRCLSLLGHLNRPNTLLLRQGLTELAGHQYPGIPLSLPLQLFDYRQSRCTSVLMWVLQIKLMSSCLHGIRLST